MALPVIDSATLRHAYIWLCYTRRTFPAHADIWDLRFHWASEQNRIYHALNAGQYRFRPLLRVHKASGDDVVLWSSADALVIKGMASILTTQLPTHPLCTHIAGHGGGNASLIQLHALLQGGHYHFVCRTDIKQYYEHINKTFLFAQLQTVVTDTRMVDLLHQFLHYSVEYGGDFTTNSPGMTRGSALSPLLAAFHLYLIDKTFANNPHLNYLRYMDDFLLLADTRWHLRNAVRRLNQFFNTLGFEQHPDKTFIGRIEKGFDWMGYWINAQGIVGISPRAWKNHLVKLSQRYAQAHRLPSKMRWQKVAAYRRRWWSHWSFLHSTHHRVEAGSLPRAFVSYMRTVLGR